MPERLELRTNDNSPTPVLRRAPALLDSHGDSMGAPREKVTFVGDKADTRDSGARDVNLRRSISHRISRVATTTLGRSLSVSLRRSRSAGQSHVQGGEVGHRGAGDTRIRKVHGKDDSTHPVSAPQPVADARVSRLEGTTAFASVNDSPRHSAHAHDPAMQIELVDQQHGKSSIAEIPVPALLQQGVPMTKVSAKSQKSYIFKLDADQGQIIWESKKLRISTYISVG